MSSSWWEQHRPCQSATLLTAETGSCSSYALQHPAQPYTLDVLDYSSKWVMKEHLLTYHLKPVPHHSSLKQSVSHLACWLTPPHPILCLLQKSPFQSQVWEGQRQTPLYGIQNPLCSGYPGLSLQSHLQSHSCDMLVSFQFQLSCEASCPMCSIPLLTLLLLPRRPLANHNHLQHLFTHYHCAGRAPALPVNLSLLRTLTTPLFR